MRREIRTDKAPKPVGPYSQAVEVDGFLFLSGQIGIDPSTGKIEEGFEDQAKRIFQNIEAILLEAGYSPKDVIKVTVYLTDIGNFGKLNTIYEEFFKETIPKPARVTVGVKELPLGALLEIEVVAKKS